MISSNKNFARKEKLNLTCEQSAKASIKQDNPQLSEENVNSLKRLNSDSDAALSRKCLSTGKTRSNLSNKRETNHVYSLAQAADSAARFTHTQENRDKGAELKNKKMAANTNGECFDDWSADLEEELAGSFGQMSPFKKKIPR